MSEVTVPGLVSTPERGLTSAIAAGSRPRSRGVDPVPFSQRLAHHPVLVEVVPPKLGAAPAQIEKAIDLVGHLLDKSTFDAVNIPEILGSGFQGMDPLEFGLLLRERFDIELVVNKVVVHEPVEDFRSWVRRALDAEMASVILIGGERSGIYYPGPRVTEANRIARQLADEGGRRDFRVGNVTLPQRPGEALRMLEKSKSGCDFFTSQIIYDFPSANVHLQAYDDVCALDGVEPRPVLYAFSPADTRQDILFLRYLGVNVPPEVEKEILAATTPGESASTRIILDVWTRLLAAATARAVRVPLGIVVETVSRHNADTLPALTRRLRAGFSDAVASAPKRRSPA